MNPAAGQPPGDDWTLLQRARHGDASCARALVRQLTPTALGLAMQLLRKREDAQDAVQEAFARLWRSHARDDRGAALGSYFNTIVINRCRSMLVAAQREWVTEPEQMEQLREAEADAADPTPPDGAADLIAALAQLPVRQRMAVVMWAWGDADIAAIAQQLEMQPNAAHQLLHRAKRALRQHLLNGVLP